MIRPGKRSIITHKRKDGKPVFILVTPRREDNCVIFDDLELYSKLEYAEDKRIKDQSAIDDAAIAAASAEIRRILAAIPTDEFSSFDPEI
jgi:hypothetical protein